MTRQYTKVKHIIPEVLKLKQEGKTHREIAKIYGLSKNQVKKLVGRYNRMKRKDEEDIPRVILRGRPRKTPLTPRQELEQENKRLKMEVELLRSFLQAAGRR